MHIFILQSAFIYKHNTHTHTLRIEYEHNIISIKMVNSVGIVNAACVSRALE